MTEWPYGMKIRPLATWPGAMTKNRGRSLFSAGMSATVGKLEREIREVSGRDVVLQIAIEERDLRVDGMPRASARPSHPGVILTMTTPGGVLGFPCDTFDRWQDNLRAIALTMEHLRTVKRYGVAQNGEQYRGFLAVESASAAPRFTSTRDALAALRKSAGLDDAQSYPDLASLIRWAQRNAHPDMSSGSHEAAAIVNAAADYLRRQS